MRSRRVLAVALLSLLSSLVLLGTVVAAPSLAPTGSVPPGRAPASASLPTGVPSASTAEPEVPEPASPRARITAWSPDGVGPYGVGIIIRLAFDRDIPAQRQQRIEDAITVTTSMPIGSAGWTWLDARTMAFRPKHFWPAHISVRVDSALGASFSFAIGRSQVLRIDAATQVGRLHVDGERLRDIPVSLGKTGWETRSGVKTIMERYRVRRMTSREIGDETEDYDLKVPYALRLTPTGEFLHAAPWAESRLGVYAGSHGCTNLSLHDGRWFFKHALQGDPVITEGTGRPMETWNGPGAAWNIPWSEWTR